MANGKTSLPYLRYYSFHLCKYGKASDKQICEYYQSQYAGNGDVEIGRGKKVNEEGSVGTRLLYKFSKDSGLQQKSGKSYYENTDRIDDTLRNDCSERFGKRHSFILGKNAAT